MTVKVNEAGRCVSVLYQWYFITLGLQNFQVYQWRARWIFSPSESYSNTHHMPYSEHVLHQNNFTEVALDLHHYMSNGMLQFSNPSLFSKALEHMLNFSHAWKSHCLQQPIVLNNLSSYVLSWGGRYLSTLKFFAGFEAGGSETHCCKSLLCNS